MDQGLTTMHSLPLIHQVLSSDQQRHFLAIESLNQHFYEYYALAFHSTRAFGWRGWRALLDLHTHHELKVLDIGCGGGRLADFLQKFWVRELERSISQFTGVERSQGLLEQAKQRDVDIPTSWAFYDWAARDKSCTTIESNQDWITLFGVMHHIYGYKARLHMIESMAKYLKVGGVISISHWNFGADQRYHKKLLDWTPFLESYPELSAHYIESGDFLLGWSGDTHIPRFCHWVSPEEESQLLDSIAKRLPELSSPVITIVEGDQNRYISWRLLHAFNPA